MVFLELSFMSALSHVNLNASTVALVIECQATGCIILAVQCFLSVEKQRSSGSFHNIPRKLEIKSKESASQRCHKGSPWDHTNVL